MSRRTDRVGAQLLEEIARVLRAEVTDPRVRLVTLTRIDVSPDLSHALVYWSAFPTKKSGSPDTIQAGLASAARFVRSRVARALSLKHMPELRFCYDPSLELGDQTLSILRSLDDDSA